MMKKLTAMLQEGNAHSRQNTIALRKANE